jgi:hypothetical protein
LRYLERLCTLTSLKYFQESADRFSSDLEAKSVDAESSTKSELKASIFTSARAIPVTEGVNEPAAALKLKSPAVTSQEANPVKPVPHSAHAAMLEAQRRFARELLARRKLIDTDAASQSVATNALETGQGKQSTNVTDMPSTTHAEKMGATGGVRIGTERVSTEGNNPAIVAM